MNISYLVYLYDYFHTILDISLFSPVGNLWDMKQTLRLQIANTWLSHIRASSPAPQNWLVCITQSNFVQRADFYIKLLPTVILQLWLKLRLHAMLPLRM